MDNDPYRGAVAVTPHDINSIPTTRGLYIGGAGAVTVRMHQTGTDVAFAAVPVGAILPISVTHVRATGTAATLILALY